MQPVIEVRNLSKFYKIPQKKPGISGTLQSFFHPLYRDVKAIENISLTVGKGELVGFIGPNGAGKTTTLKCLSGLLYPTGGELKVLGFTPSQRKRDFLKQISLVMGQKNQLWWDLPASDTFLLQKAIYELSDDLYTETLNELTSLFAVGDLLETPVRKLSLGQRMKMELIAALLHKPKVLFLDEPTIGLDVVMQKAVREFIKAYNQRYHASILLTSHYMQDVKELCKRVIMIDKGRVLYDGTLEKLTQKFASHKIITIIFAEPVDVLKLAQFGEIVEFDFPKVALSVSRKSTNMIAAKLLKGFRIEDINIEEPSIEAIIRTVFETKEV